MRRLAVVVAVVAVLALVRPAPVLADPSGAQPVYRPPVTAPIVDGFRPPAQEFGPGNRGVDYAPQAGSPVAAAAEGEVVFAGQVGGGLHVVVLHPDGIRTSYSFLRSISVARGQRVTQGQTVGTARDRFHFGARIGDTYIDPTSLFAGALPEVHLVPDEVRRPASEAVERQGLLASLRGLRSMGRLAAGALRWAGRGAAAAGRAAFNSQLAALGSRLEELRGLASNFYDTFPITHALRVARSVVDWQAQLGDCTPESESPPPTPGRNHIAVLVPGLGSSDDKKDQHVTDVDTAALGYAEDDTYRFSYKGGTSEESPYTGRDTSTDIRESARHLRHLLERVAREHPGVRVDLIAHSQGGIVTRQALAMEADDGDPQLPPINSVVLIGAPNTGADLATAANMLGHSTSGYATQTAVAWALPRKFDPRGDSIHQLAETSTILARLNHTPLPARVHVTSIGARKDTIVPARHTRLTGAHNITVDFAASPLTTHMELPGSAAARREVALAIARKPPTCQSLADMVVDAATTEAITHAEDTFSNALWFAGKWVDGKANLPSLNH